MSKTVKTAVVGASGYSGAQLLRLLLMHPNAQLTGVTSRQYAGDTLSQVFPRFRGDATADSLTFIEPDIAQIAASGAEIVFLALPHGVASEFAGSLLKEGLKVIDLSADFRLHDPAVYEDFYGAPHPDPDLLDIAVYGMPEIHGAEVEKATLVASPGCYPTSVILPLVPLLRDGLVDSKSIRVSSMSGVSGAGKSVVLPFLYAECNESLRAYSVPRHRHLSEIEQELSIAAGETVVISFTTHLVPVTAGIHTTIYADAAEGSDAKAVAASLEKAYGDAPFVRLLGEGGCPDTKNVVGTNFIDIGFAHDSRTNRFIILSAEDNLGKGAASQAVQSMNRMCGFAETAGLLNY